MATAPGNACQLRPASPASPARHCREARRPEVSGRAIFNLARWPPKRQRDSPRRECAGSRRQPVPALGLRAFPLSVGGTVLSGCRQARHWAGGREPRGCHGGGGPTAELLVIAGASNRGTRAAGSRAGPRPGAAQRHGRALWGRGLGHPGGLRRPQLRQADGPLRAAGKSVLARSSLCPLPLCPSQCSPHPWPGWPVLLHFPDLPS